MALRNYNVTARLGGDPTAAGASGLTPTWVFFDTEAGLVLTNPTFTNPGSKGIYRFQYDAIANGEAVGIVDFGSGFTDPNERYADVVVTLDGALIQTNLDAQVSTRNSGTVALSVNDEALLTSLRAMISANAFTTAALTNAPTGGSGGSSSFLQTPTGTIPVSANYIKQGDLSPQRQAFLVDALENGINLTGCTVKYALYTKGSRTTTSTLLFQKTASILYAAQGLVGYTWAAGDTDIAGKYVEEWTVYDASNNPLTAPSNGTSPFTINAHGG